MFRGYVLALAWSVSNRTDGRLEVADLDMVPGCTLDTAEALVAAGLWTAAEDGTGWTIADFLSTQTSRDQLEGLELKKRQDAERARAYRSRKKSADHVSASGEESREHHVTASRDDIGQDRARTGQALTTGDSQNRTPNDNSKAASPGSLWRESLTPANRCKVPDCGAAVTPYSRQRFGQYCPGHGEELAAPVLDPSDPWNTGPAKQAGPAVDPWTDGLRP